MSPTEQPGPCVPATPRSSGFLAHLVTTSPFTTDMMRAVERTVEEAGKVLLIADSGTGQAERSFRLFAEFQAASVIFATS